VSHPVIVPLRRRAYLLWSPPILLGQTATGQDNDASLDRTSERTTIFADTRLRDDDKTLDAATSCKEPKLTKADSSCSRAEHPILKMRVKSKMCMVGHIGIRRVLTLPCESDWSGPQRLDDHYSQIAVDLRGRGRPDSHFPDLVAVRRMRKCLRLEFRQDPCLVNHMAPVLGRFC
jgi:hypothetical protein